MFSAGFEFSWCCCWWKPMCLVVYNIYIKWEIWWVVMSFLSIASKPFGQLWNGLGPIARNIISTNKHCPITQKTGPKPNTIYRHVCCSGPLITWLIYGDYEVYIWKMCGPLSPNFSLCSCFVCEKLLGSFPSWFLLLILSFNT